jgi:hypothetical protein
MCHYGNFGKCTLKFNILGPYMRDVGRFMEVEQHSQVHGSHFLPQKTICLYKITTVISNFPLPGFIKESQMVFRGWRTTNNMENSVCTWDVA